jgi:hypothetical protein
MTPGEAAVMNASATDAGQAGRQLSTSRTTALAIAPLDRARARRARDRRARLRASASGKSAQSARCADHAEPSKPVRRWRTYVE